MKKLLIIAIALMCYGLTTEAQTQRYEMRLWQGNKYVSYPIESVDSVTFVLQNSGEDDNKSDEYVTDDIDYGPKTTTSRIRYDFVELYQEHQENIICNNTDTQLRFANGLNQKEYYRGDCLWLEGKYDVTFPLPVVPTTENYEIRIGYTASDANGMCQIYFGSDPNSLRPFGIPSDFRISGNSELSGWEADIQDSEFNEEVDKRMRAIGFMKAPAVPFENGIQVQDETTKYVLRPNPSCLRRIVVRQQLNADTQYYLRLKTVFVFDRPISLDYIEFCPQSVYGNQEVAEDRY